MSDALSEKFLSRWRALAADIGLEEVKSEEIGGYLLTQYCRPDRHYHGAGYIVAMLDGFDTLKAKSSTPLPPNSRSSSMT